MPNEARGPKLTRDVLSVLTNLKILPVGISHPSVFIESMPEAWNYMSLPSSTGTTELKPQQSASARLNARVKVFLIREFISNPVLGSGIVHRNVRDGETIQHAPD